jgi:hypothetical protein
MKLDNLNVPPLFLSYLNKEDELGKTGRQWA